MNKIAILIFALAISHAYGACDTDIKDHFGITGTIEAAAAANGATLASCTSLQSQTTCCLDAFFDTFTTQKTTLQTTIEGLVETRDQYLIDSRAAVAEQLSNGNIAAMITALAAASSNIASWSETLPDGATFTKAEAEQVGTDAATIIALFATFKANYATLYNGFDTYRQARATCFTEVLKDVVSSWCTACLEDTGRAAYGITVASNAVTVFTFGATVKGRLAAACQPYFVASEQQSGILDVFPYAAVVDEYTAALVKIAAGTQAGVAEFLAVTPTTLTSSKSEIASETCSTTACDWIETNIFELGVLNNANLVLGGNEDNTRRRILEGRVLQTGSAFVAAPTESKITIAFPEVVGSVTNTVDDLSALRVGVFSCIVAFFVALLF